MNNKANTLLFLALTLLLIIVVLLVVAYAIDDVKAQENHLVYLPMVPNGTSQCEKYYNTNCPFVPKNSEWPGGDYPTPMFIITPTLAPTMDPWATPMPYPSPEPTPTRG